MLKKILLGFDLELHMIPKAGHWVQQEAPELVNGRMLDWLNRRFKAEGEHAGGQS